MSSLNSWRRRLQTLLVLLFCAGAAQAQAVRVGSKIDTEGALLGNLVVQVLEAGGVKTENKLQLGNTKIMRAALVAGEIDLYLNAFDEPERFEPQAHVYFADRLPWFDTRDRLPRAQSSWYSRTSPCFQRPSGNLTSPWQPSCG